MDINRNQFFLAGLVFLLLGLQFRVVESAVLTPQLTQFLAEQTGHPAVAATDAVASVTGAVASTPPKKVIPPDWFGWCLLSIGSVLVLHSLAMSKPG